MKKTAENYSYKQSFMPTLSLFTSIGTLLCCALPALLVTLGAGAPLAGIVSSAPWLVALSKYKVWTFSLSAVLILMSGILLWQARNMPCPADPIKARACQKMRKISLWVYYFSVLIWLIGYFFAFVAVHVFY